MVCCARNVLLNGLTLPEWLLPYLDTSCVPLLLCPQIGLVLLDEVHLLNESGRGSSLEAGCVCRIKAVAALPEMTGSHLASVRFVAVSATIPNISDVSAHPGCCWVTTGKPLHAYLWPMDMQRHS